MIVRSSARRGRSRVIPLAGWSLLLALCAAPASPALAQSSALGVGQYDTSYLEPAEDAAQEAAAPKLVFRLATEIALPGPLPGYGPRLVDGRLHIPVSGGLAESGWEEESEVRVQPLGEIERNARDEQSLLWALAPNGKARYALTEDGFLLAQKRCRSCPVGWRRRWRLRVAGVDLAPPLVTEKRVFYGALDNRVYAVKRRNGHRVWEADLEGRISRRLRLWQPPEENEPPAYSLVLVVPDDGSGIVALDARTGAKVASWELQDDDGQLIGDPVVTPDGGIVVARQKYMAEDASLMVFRLVPPRQPA